MKPRATSRSTSRDTDDCVMSTDELSSRRRMRCSGARYVLKSTSYSFIDIPTSVNSRRRSRMIDTCARKSASHASLGFTDGVARGVG
jgi:hypothetical protein